MLVIIQSRDLALRKQSHARRNFALDRPAQGLVHARPRSVFLDRERAVDTRTVEGLALLVPRAEVRSMSMIPSTSICTARLL